jgi:uncharacterized linocin/CFP29 family protein
VPSILRRENAPVSDQAWAEIDSEASRTLQGNLVGRQVVDFSGPHGWQLGAVNLGRLEQTKKGAVPYGIRAVQPLVEIRIPFTLSQWELDNVTRGAEDADLDPVVEAATKAARFEDEAILTGFKPGNIEGLSQLAENKPVPMPRSAEEMPQAIGKAIQAMIGSGVGGPWSLVVHSEVYYQLYSGGKGGMPPYKIVQDLLEGGQILPSPVIPGGLLVSQRGGDFEMTVGKDYAVGYSSHTAETVEFFLTESFTFHIADPAAAVVLKSGAKK